MEKTGLIIDSTVYLPENVIKERNIAVVPLNVIEGENVYKETDITPQFVYDELDAGRKLSTSQPSPEQFREAYARMFEKGYEKLVVITISNGLSGTYQSALLAKELIDRASDVHVFDTQNAGFGNELLALEFLRFLDEAESLQEAIRRTEEVIRKTQLFFTVENLFSLQKGGRLSKRSALLGTVLRIRPIIRLVDGELVLVHKERTTKRLQRYILKMIKDDAQDAEEVRVRMVHRRSPDMVESLKSMIEETFRKVEVTITDYIGPVFAIHIGKKGFGVVWYAV